MVMALGSSAVAHHRVSDRGLPRRRERSGPTLSVRSGSGPGRARLASSAAMGSLIKKRRKRMRKKKHKKMLKATRWQRRAGK